MDRTKLHNRSAVLLLTLCLGAAAGLVIWLFLLAMSEGTRLIWELLPRRTGLGWITLPLCALGGLAVGLLHRRYGDYPEELPAVLGKVKNDRHYDYHSMPALLLCALLPLVFGASVGPEAGLTGIIVALCYWVGDNVSLAKRHAALYSELGEAVTLGHIFHFPLFGILAVEEEGRRDGKPTPLPRPWKLALYGLSTAASFGAIGLLNRLFHRSGEGFPSFSDLTIQPGDYAALLLYLPVGVLLYLVFRLAEKGAEAGAEKIPVVLRETLCGLAVGAVGLAAPAVLFSGEEQMARLIEDGSGLGPWRLMGVCLLKLVLTAFCLRFGMKGGHFFPMIFACACMGFALAGLVFPDPSGHTVFAAGVVTAAALGAQIKKPLAVSALALLCFPARMLFWLFLAAAVGGRLAELLEKRGRRSPELADAASPAEAEREAHTAADLSEEIYK